MSEGFSFREKFDLIKELFQDDGGRLYGDLGTIHGNRTIDVVVDNGVVTEVWYRCIPLAFSAGPRPGFAGESSKGEGAEVLAVVYKEPTDGS